MISRKIAPMREQHRHQRDVDDLQARAELLDFDIEAAAGVAQFLANAHALVLEALELGFLLGRQRQRRLATAAAGFERRRSSARCPSAL